MRAEDRAIAPEATLHSSQNPLEVNPCYSTARPDAEFICCRNARGRVLLQKPIRSKPFNRQTQVLTAVLIPSRKDMKLQPDAMSFNGATWLEEADCLGLRGKGSGYTVRV